MPERYFLIGERVSNSPTPRMMNTAFDALGLDAAYGASEVGSDKLGICYAEFKTEGVSGLNVTIPHKVSIIGLLDSLDQVSRRVGAVNTVKKEGTTFKGYNTDVDGIFEPLKSRGISKPGRVFVIGTGGASRAACQAMSELGCRDLTVLSRNIEKAAGFVSSMKEALPAMGMEAAHIGGPPPGRPDIVFNASPMGSNGIPLHRGIGRLLEAAPLVFDAVYFPVETELIRQAKNCGCVAIHGYEMLLYQASRTFEIWTGRSPPLEPMKASLMQSLGVAAF
ncbi:MAG TPA: shikimate dehydrogenase [Nitrososphaerales archaeon]|nr:shikimate dehydrogenase [Nitrososphaerales archaeon]